MAPLCFECPDISKPKVRSCLLLHRFLSPVFFYHPTVSYLSPHAVARCYPSSLPPCCHVLPGVSATLLPRVAYLFCHLVVMRCLSSLPPGCHVLPILSATLLPRIAYLFCHPVATYCLYFLPPCCHVVPILSATLLPHVPQLPLPSCCQAYPDFCFAKGILTSAVLLPL